MRPLLALYRTLLRTIDTRARRWSFVVLGLVGVAVAWAVSTSFFVEPVPDAVSLLDLFNLTFLAPVAGLVFGTAALGDPTDDNTLVYLWLRPVARWKIVVAAVAAAATYVVPFAVVPAVAEAMIVAGTPEVVRAAAISSVVAGLAYSAAFVLLGLVSRRSLVWGIGYLLIFESFVARGGSSLGALSIHAHAASVLARTSGVKLRLGYFSTVTGVVVCLAITVLATAVTTRRLARAEVP